MKQLLLVIGTCCFYNSATAKDKYNYSIGFQMGGNLNFSRNNKLAKPHVYQYPNIFPTAGFTLSGEVNRKHIFTFSYLYLSYGNNLKFDRDPEHKGRNTLSSSALNHELAVFYHYPVLNKFIIINAGIGIDYYNSKDRGKGPFWGVGNYDLGIVETDEMTHTEHSMGLLPSISFAKSYRHTRANISLAYRFGTTKLHTSKYVFYKNAIPEEQYMNNYGDMFILKLSIEYWLKKVRY